MRVKKRPSSGSSSEPVTPIEILTKQDEEMTNQLQGSAPAMICTSDDPKELVEKLTAAIQAGNASYAAALVAEISKQRLKLDINLPKEDLEQRGKEKEFSVKVHVEDRVSAGCYINLTVRSSDTILDLKRKVMLKHNFPMEVQRWIIGKKIPEDKERISRCGIKGPGHTLYLYLVTARSMGLSREDYEAQRQAMLAGRVPLSINQQGIPSGPDQISWVSPLSPSESKFQVHSNSLSPVRTSSPVVGSEAHEGNEQHPLSSRHGSRKSLSSGSSMLHEMLSAIGTVANTESVHSEGRVSVGNDGAAGPILRTPSPSESDTGTEGWSCKACTYINPPTRPGCKMCSASRPVDYQVPPNYKMTLEEMVFMQNEQRLERMTREAVPTSESSDLIDPHHAGQGQRRSSSKRITNEHVKESLQLIQALRLHERDQDSRKNSSSKNNQAAGNALIYVPEGSQWDNVQELLIVPDHLHESHPSAQHAQGQGAHRNFSPARLLRPKAPAMRQPSPVSFYDDLIAEPPTNIDPDEGYPSDDENSLVD